MTITNRHLAIILSWVIVFTLVGTIISLTRIGQIPFLTGAGTTGIANLTVSTFTLINFTNSSITWGLGVVSPNVKFAILESNGTVYQGNWSTLNNGFRVANVGNTYVNLSLNNTKGTANNNSGPMWIGGTNAQYYINISEENANSTACDATTGYMMGLGNYIDVNGSNGLRNNTNGFAVCQNFSYKMGNNYLALNFKLVIPEDSIRGYLEDTWTGTATAI